MTEIVVAIIVIALAVGVGIPLRRALKSSSPQSAAWEVELMDELTPQEMHARLEQLINDRSIPEHVASHEVIAPLLSPETSLEDAQALVDGIKRRLMAYRMVQHVL